jgi:hypothetical protein
MVLGFSVFLDQQKTKGETSRCIVVMMFIVNTVCQHKPFLIKIPQKESDAI